MNNLNNIFRYTTKRNGFDELEKLLLIIYFPLFIISFFYKNLILDLVCIFLVIIIVFRFLSKNIKNREKENDIYISVKNKILLKSSNNDYVYKKCSKCHTMLRLPLPNKRGFKHVKCPKCGKRLTILILKKLKVEVIRKGGKND